MAAVPASFIATLLPNAIACVNGHTYLVKSTGVHLDRNFGPGSDPVTLPHGLYQQSHQLRGAERRCAPSEKKRLHPTIIVAPSACTADGSCAYLFNDVIDVRPSGFRSCPWAIAYNLFIAMPV